ncbi:MAG: lipopolysaccharide heptosyltransferase II [Candidatus Kapabacteria bacterium]|nr:lipopolysaccharide heptosyltransferase II [Candidatus Kapabacteria bacterium]
MKQSVHSVSSILLIRLSSMGDVLLATPAVRALRNTFPHAQIDVAVAKKFAEVWKHNPHINTVVEIDTSESVLGSSEIRKQLFKTVGRYDVIVDCQRNLRSWFLRRGLAKQTLFYEKFRAEKMGMVGKKVFPERITHVVTRYYNALLPLGVQPDELGLELWLPEEQQTEYPPSQWQILTAHAPVAFAPGARHATKRWPAEYFVQLAKKLHTTYNTSVVLVGGADDKELCKHIAKECGEFVTDCSGASSLYQTARLLDSCSLLVTNDSGVMHIAAARQIPTVAIFGSTVQHFGFTPYKVRNTIVEQQLPCRPCTHIGKSECPLGHFNCMKQVLPEQVYLAVTEMLA